MIHLGSVPWRPDPARQPLGLAPTESFGWSADVCPRCFGAGVLRVDVLPGQPGFGTVRPCDHPRCRQRSEGETERLWRTSGFRPDAVDPPSFANFRKHDRASIRMLSAAQRWADTPRGWLVLHGLAGDKEYMAGHAGAGKSHLAEAIFRALLARGVGCMYWRADALFEHLGAQWHGLDDDVDYDRRLQKILRADVLIIDEFGREGDSDAVARLRYKVIEARWRAAIYGDGPAAETGGSGATMLCSNLHPKAWADRTIASRALDDRFLVVEATDVDFRQVPR